MDEDDDNDGVADTEEILCQFGVTNWISNATTDYDGDGCRDSDEDPDDDNDGIADTEDACRRSPATDSSTSVTPRGCLPVPAGGLNTRAVPLQEGMRLEWTNPSAAQIPGNIAGFAGFNVSWRRLSDNATGMENKTDETDAAVDASHELTNLTDEREHQFLVYAVIPDEDPILVLNLTATTGANYDNDSEPDFLDEDDDNDGVADTDDRCATSTTIWTSNATTDYDGDGCRDGFAEETDDDNDGVLNTADTVCPRGATDWISNAITDHDGDGCRDGFAEETDDDNDGVLNTADIVCPRGQTNWTSNAITDYDGDGCRDGFAEETDDDNDGVNNAKDECLSGTVGQVSTSVTDRDGDGCLDESDNDTLIARAVPLQEGMRLEWVNPDADNISLFNVSWQRLSDNATGTENKTDETDAGVDAFYELTNLTDEEEHQFLVYAMIRGEDPILVLNLTATTGANHDNDSEPDSWDDDDDNDGVNDYAADGITQLDACPRGDTGWTSNQSADNDDDGCRDAGEDPDDDGDGVYDTDDRCARNATGWTSNSVTDYDGDGCRDRDEDPDDDNDGIADTEDACRRSPATDSSTSVTPRGCLPVPAGGLNTRAVPLQEGMRLEWTNPSAAANPGQYCRVCRV